MAEWSMAVVLKTASIGYPKTVTSYPPVRVRNPQNLAVVRAI